MPCRDEDDETAEVGVSRVVMRMAVVLGVRYRAAGPPFRKLPGRRAV